MQLAYDPPAAVAGSEKTVDRPTIGAHQQLLIAHGQATGHPFERCFPDQLAFRAIDDRNAIATTEHALAHPRWR